MTAPFYIQSGAPKPDASGLSSAIRKEFLSIEEGMEEANLFGLTQLLPDMNLLGGGAVGDQFALFAVPFDLRVVGLSWVVTGASFDGAQLRLSLIHGSKGNVEWAGQLPNSSIGCVLRSGVSGASPLGSIAYEGINDTDSSRAVRGDYYKAYPSGALGTNATEAMLTLWVKRI